MRVLFFATYGLWTPHLETELELASQHIEAGDEVVWVVCDDALGMCDANTRNTRKHCARCQLRLEDGLGMLPGPVTRLRLSALLDAEDRAQVAALPTHFRTQAEVKAFEFEGFDAGWGALSSAIWEKCDADVDLTRDVVGRFLRAGVTAYLASRRLLRETGAEAIDRVYIFNGRMAPLRGVLRAAQQAGIPCTVHERGRDVHHYALYEDCMPHDIEPTVPRIATTWASTTLPPAEREALARQWFEDRAQGVMGAWTSYVGAQRQGTLPDDWDPTRRNVVFFTTTEYEFAAIGKEWHSDLFDGPTDAALKVAAELSRRGEVHLTMRLHPNKTTAVGRSIKGLLALRLPHVTIVPPESPVSTYALMRAADAVVTSGSTTGIEATFWGRVSILAGRGLYSGLGASYEPKTHAELYDQIHDPNLPPLDPLPALQYGFYQATLGLPFRHFEPDGLFRGTYDGRALGHTRLQHHLTRGLGVLDAVAPRIRR